jgi:hypothetical protein
MELNTYIQNFAWKISWEEFTKDAAEEVKG